MISGSYCAESAGFLFKHPCDQQANLECQQCGKRICDQHAGSVGGVTMCVTCRKASRTTSQDHYDYDHDPYFYGSNYYSGWGYYHYTSSHHEGGDERGESHGHDADDFTEADGAAMGVAASESFETDMEGS
jgi:hypothetical protein